MRLAFIAAVAMSVAFGLLIRFAQTDEPRFADVAPSEARTPEEERKGFRLPPGFEVELVAAEPYVRKPININFDARGRLWVTELIEYPFAAKPGEAHRDTVRILDWSDGRLPAQEVTTFTSGLNIPIGSFPNAMERLFTASRTSTASTTTTEMIAATGARYSTARSARATPTE